MLLLFVITTVSFWSLGSGKVRNTTNQVDTMDDIPGTPFSTTRELGYVQNIIQFFRQAEAYSKYVKLPNEPTFKPLENLQGLWYTLWNDLMKPRIDASMLYTSINEHLLFLSIRYVMCEDSNITVTFADQGPLVMVNTKQGDNYTCDAAVQEKNFTLNLPYEVKISLNANTNASFAMIDKLIYAKQVIEGTENPETKPIQFFLTYSGARGEVLSMGTSCHIVMCVLLGILLFLAFKSFYRSPKSSRLQSAIYFGEKL